jgi:hypothetical protein
MFQSFQRYIVWETCLWYSVFRSASRFTVGIPLDSIHRSTQIILIYCLVVIISTTSHELRSLLFTSRVVLYFPNDTSAPIRPAPKRFLSFQITISLSVTSNRVTDDGLGASINPYILWKMRENTRNFFLFFSTLILGRGF